MDKHKPAWWESRYPVPYLVIGGLWATVAIMQVAAGHYFYWGMLVLVAGVWASAIATMVRRHRAGFSVLHQGPLAQESDPARR